MSESQALHIGTASPDGRETAWGSFECQLIGILDIYIWQSTVPWRVYWELQYVTKGSVSPSCDWSLFGAWPDASAAASLVRSSPIQRERSTAWAKFENWDRSSSTPSLHSSTVFLVQLLLCYMMEKKQHNVNIQKGTASPPPFLRRSGSRFDLTKQSLYGVLPGEWSSDLGGRRRPPTLLPAPPSRSPRGFEGRRG